MSERRSVASFLAGAVRSRWKFIWLFGALGFGVPFGLVFGLLLTNLKDLANHPEREKVLIVAGTTMIVGPVAGFLWGLIMWIFRPLWIVQSMPRETGVGDGMEGADI